MDLISVRQQIECLWSAAQFAAPNNTEFQLLENLLKKILDTFHVSAYNVKSPLVAAAVAKLSRSLNIIQCYVDREQKNHELATVTTNIIPTAVDTQQRNVVDFYGTLIDLCNCEVELLNNRTTKLKNVEEALSDIKKLLQEFHTTYKEKATNLVKDYAMKNLQEQLKVLRQKYAYIIMPYLNQFTVLHGTITVSCLEASAVCQVAHQFYRASSIKLQQLKRIWGPFEIPLPDFSISLQTETSTSFEKKAACEMLMRTVDRKAGFDTSSDQTTKTARLVDQPYMPSLIRGNRFVVDVDPRAEEILQILRENRCAVILGDPGSGKTTLVRWLAYRYAKELANKKTEIDSVPIRIPILIRIGEFAEALHNDPTLTLYDYIGHHKWFGKSSLDDTVSPTLNCGDLSVALQDYVKRGQSIVILDGLDEVFFPEQRSRVLNTVENFFNNYVHIPIFESAFGNANYLRYIVDKPDELGGNQLLITSRIIGYHAAPLSGQFTHFIVRPMDLEQMKQYVYHWFMHVHAQIYKLLTSMNTLIDKKRDHYKSQADSLYSELENGENIGLQGLGSNPFLMGYLCTIAFSSETITLPRQRLIIYEETVKSMFSAWRHKGLKSSPNKLIWILEDIAVHIHTNFPSGLIGAEQLNMLCLTSVRSYENKQNPTEEDLRRYHDDSTKFIQLIHVDFGILAARGESLYGFLHLTFQEYFTGLSLINTIKLKNKVQSPVSNETELLGRSLSQYIGNPRFYEPLVIAFGRLSEREDFDEFCSIFLKESHLSSPFMPLGPLFLIECRKDLINLPAENILYQALDELLLAATRNNWYANSQNLFSNLVDSIRKLPPKSVMEWIRRHLVLCMSSQSVQTVKTLCLIIEIQLTEDIDNTWVDQSMYESLFSLSQISEENNDFTIDRVLIEISAVDHSLFPISMDSLKMFLFNYDIELRDMHPSIFAILICLYGGLTEDNENIIFNQKCIHRESQVMTPHLVQYFSNIESTPKMKLERLKSRCYNMLLSIAPTNISSSSTDIIIAVMCLEGIEILWSQPNLFQRKCFSLALARLKHVSFLLRHLFLHPNSKKFGKQLLQNWMQIYDNKNNTNKIGYESSKYFLKLTNSTMKAFARLDQPEKTSGKRDPIFYLPNSLKEKDLLKILLTSNIEPYSQEKPYSFMPEFINLFWLRDGNFGEPSENNIFTSDWTYLCDINKDPMFAIAFLPENLIPLYHCLLQQHDIVTQDTEISEKNLCFQHILIEILMNLSMSSCKRSSTDSAINALLPLLNIYKLGSLSACFSCKTVSDIHCFINSLDQEEPIHPDTSANANPGDGSTTDTLYKYLDKSHQHIQKALSKINKHEKNEQANVDLYVASISLSYESLWYSNPTLKHFFHLALNAALAVQFPLLRFDALCTIALNLNLQPEKIHLNNGQTLIKEIELLLPSISMGLTPILHTAILRRSVLLLGNNPAVDKSAQCLIEKLKPEHHMNDSDKYAIHKVLCEFSPANESIRLYLHNLVQRINRSTIHELSQYVSLRSNIFSLCFAQYSSLAPTQPTVLFLSTIFLLELTRDCQMLIYFIENLNTKPAALLHQVEHNRLLIYTSQILTHTVAFTIERCISYCVSKNEQVEELMKLSQSLHEIVSVECSALKIIQGWLDLENHPKLKLFAWHAALLIMKSELWSIKAIHIVWKLLSVQHDRFRRRAEMIIESSENKSSSCLSLDSVMAIMYYYSLSYRDSTRAVKPLMNRIYNILIDNFDHLEFILQTELTRISMNNHSKTNESTISNTKITCNSANDQSINYFYVSLGIFFHKLQPDMCVYIVNTLKFEFDVSDCFSTLGMTVSGVVYESFVVNVLISLGYSLIDKSDGTRKLAEAIIAVVQTSSVSRIQRAAVYALGFTRLGAKCLFDVIRTVTTNSDQSNRYTVDVICSSIRAYCYQFRGQAFKFDQERTINFFQKLLKHPSPLISRAARQGLGCVIRTIERLLEILDNDDIHCYEALFAGTCSYPFVSSLLSNRYNLMKRHTQAATYIERHPELLVKFISDFYNTISYFRNDIHYEDSEFYKFEYGYPDYVSVAAIIVERMPVAFCAQVNKYDFGEELKLILYYVSKRQQGRLRIPCLTILSVFGELTADILDILVELLVESPTEKEVCYRCLGRITHMQNTSIVTRFNEYLTSISMNTRYTAAILLIRLNALALLPMSVVTETLIQVINDPTSDEEFLVAEQLEYDAGVLYHNAGKLKDVVYNSLAMYMLSRTNDKPTISDLTSLSSDQYRLDSDFLESETLAQTTSCLFDTETTDVSTEREITDDGDSDILTESEDEIDAYL